MVSLLVLSLLSCGVEREDVKTLADPPALKMNPDSFSGASVAVLSQGGAPAWDDHAPRAGAERIIHEVNGVLVGAKLEADQDVHIVIADSAAAAAAGKTMIAEIPDPSCMKGAPKWAVERVTKARALFLSLMRVSAKYRKLPKPIPVVMRGVTFYDKPHGQTGVAPNGVELHPLFDLAVVKPEPKPDAGTR